MDPVVTANQSVATAHGMDWFANDEATQLSINGQRVSYSWILFDAVGHHITKGSERGKATIRSKLDFFQLMFPPKQLDEMIQNTNLELEKLQMPATNTGEMLKLFGISILAARFEF
jgi:hypothetical protein